MSKEFSDNNFTQEVINSNIPVLVDFWAEWCGPCKVIAPLLDELAEEYQGKLKVGKLNTNINNKTPVTFNINALPTILLFNKGQVEKKFVGLTKKKDIKEAIDKLIGDDNDKETA